MHVGRHDAKPARVDKIFVDISLRHLLAGHALFIGFFDNLVVHIGKVLHKLHLIAPVGQIAAQTVKHDKGARIPDVKIVVNGRAAGINGNFALL